MTGFIVSLMILTFVVIGAFTQDEAINVTSYGVTFQGSRIPTTESYLRYNGELSNITALTVCFRINLQQFHKLSTVLSYATEEEPSQLNVYINRNSRLEVKCCGGKTLLSLLIGLVPLRWFSVCFSVDIVNSVWRLKYNTPMNYEDNIGKLDRGMHSEWQILDKISYVEDLTHKSMDNITGYFGKISSDIIDPGSFIEGGGTFYLGQDQTLWGGQGFLTSHSLRATLLDFRMYDNALEPLHMIDYINCEPTSEDSPTPFIDFSNIDVDFEMGEGDLEIVEVDPSFCGEPKERIVLFADNRQQKAANQFCVMTGGKLTLPESNEANKELLSKASVVAERCGIDRQSDILWLGIVLTNGHWEKTQLLGDKTLNYNNFKPEDLDTTSAALCASMITGESDTNTQSGKWLATPCEERRCFSCTYVGRYSGNFHLRGLCSSTFFDHTYSLLENNGSYSFLGFYSSIIVYHPETDDGWDGSGYWEISSTSFPRATARLPRQSGKYHPIGKNIWDIANDECGDQKVTLLLTSCENTQFTCNSGLCIERSFRCDRVMNCDDGSDEENCHVVILPPVYDHKTMNTWSHFQDVFEIGVHLTILQIKDIDLNHFKFTSVMQMSLTWYDDRLQFLNLQEQDWKNTVNERVWQPYVEFHGHGNTWSNVTEQSPTIFVHKQNPGEKTMSNIPEDVSFDGSDNPLVVCKKLMVETSCDFKLFAFPFDVQNCSLILRLSNLPEQIAMLRVGNESLQFEGEFHLSQYYFQNLSINNQTMDGHSSLQVILIFSNLSVYFLMSTYLPTIFLLFIGYLTFYFPLDDFNVRVMVTLTLLLVEATYFNQTINVVPQTSYIKMIDIWFIFCILYLFLIVVALVIIGRLQHLHGYDLNEATTQVKVFPIRLTTFYPNGIDPAPRPYPRRTQGRRKGVTASPRGFNTFCRIAFPPVGVCFIISYFVFALIWAPYWF